MPLAVIDESCTVYCWIIRATISGGPWEWLILYPVLCLGPAQKSENKDF